MGKRRRHTRAKVEPAKWVAIQSSGKTDTYPCTFMSLGGFFVECPEPPPEGSILRFALNFRGQIVRGIGKVASTTATGMGVAFVSLRVEDRAKIHYFVDSLMETALVH